MFIHYRLFWKDANKENEARNGPIKNQYIEHWFGLVYENFSAYNDWKTFKHLISWIQISIRLFYSVSVNFDVQLE